MPYWPLFRHFFLPWFVVIGPAVFWLVWNYGFEAGTWSGDRFEEYKTGPKAIWTLHAEGSNDLKAVLTAPDERQWIAFESVYGSEEPRFYFELTSEDPEYEELLYEEITAEWDHETDSFEIKVPEYMRITLHRTSRDIDYLNFSVRTVIYLGIGYFLAAAFEQWKANRKREEADRDALH